MFQSTLRTLLLAIFYFHFTPLFSQITFQKAFTDSSARWAEAIDVIATSDGYVVAGNSSTFSFVYKPFLMKINKQGDLIWYRNYAIFQGETYFRKVVRANDGGFLAVGTAHDFNGEILLVKTGADGVLQWQKIIPSYITNRMNYGQWVHSVADGYIISGGSKRNDAHAVLIKIDNQGKTIWSKRHFFYWGDNPIMNAGFVSGDTIFATGSKDSVALFSQFDANGNLLSALMLKSEDGDSRRPLHYMVPASDGDFLLAGFTFTADPFIPIGKSNSQWICRISRAGELRWSKTYPNVGHGRISPLSDGNFILTPFYHNYPSSFLNPVLLKINGDGEVLWSYQYGTDKTDAFVSAVEADDGGIVAVGFARLSNIPLNQGSILVVKTDANGIVNQCCTQYVNTTAISYPVILSEATGGQTIFDTSIDYGAPGEDGNLSAQDYCPALSSTVNVSLCPGDSIVIDGNSYTSPGQVFSTVSGPKCDTNLLYNIVMGVNPTIEKTIIFCPGDTVFLHGYAYTQPIVFTQAIPSATGQCDTLATYTLEHEAPDPNAALQLDCPADITVQANSPVPVQYAEPTAWSDCNCPDLTLVKTSGPASGAAFPLGATTVCYQADDACANARACCFTVTVAPATPPPAAACDTKTNGCLQFELLEVNRDYAQNWVYHVRLTNACSDAVQYAYLQVPKGLQALAPINDIVYTTSNGHTFTARNPNFSPFYSVRFHFANATLAGGQSETFRYVMPQQADVKYIHAAARLFSGVYVETHLNTFSCPVGTELQPKPEAGERGGYGSGGTLRVYPNPVSAEEVLFIEGADIEGSDFVLRDLTGRLVLEATVTNGQVLVGEANLADGLYFFNVLKNGLPVGSGKVVLAR